MTLILCGFPGVGKTYLCKNNDNYKILDIDSSPFKWVQGKNGERTDEKVSDFPQNYISYILKNINNADILLISTQSEVINEIKSLKLNYFIVYPDKSLKEEYYNRYYDREDLPRFVLNDNNQFENMIDIIEMEDSNRLIKLKSNEHISDVIERVEKYI